MLRINCKNIWHDSDLNPQTTDCEPCCPKPTDVTIFRTGKLSILV